MTHYIHAPHKRNFAERTKRKYIKDAVSTRINRDHFEILYGKELFISRTTNKSNKSYKIRRANLIGSLNNL